MKKTHACALFFALTVEVIPASNAQVLNWNIDTPTHVDVGGISGRTGVGAAVFGSKMYIAFTPGNDPIGDADNDNYVHILSTDGSNITTDQRIIAQTGNTASDANPSLTTTGATPLNPPYLNLALNSQQGPVDNGGFTSFFRSTDGTNFYVGPQPPLTIRADYSPSLTTDPATNDVYLGLRNAADQTLTLCRLDHSTDQWTCNNFPGTRQINFNPGLAFWNGTLYIGFVEEANSHVLRMFTSSDQGRTISENTNISNVNQDQTSSNPSLAVYNNVLYVGFRSNDSSHNLLYKSSTDGINYSVSSTTNNTRLGGAPMMVNGEGITYNSNWLWNWNSANDSTNWLWYEHAQ
jgi:hypothetical protein